MINPGSMSVHKTGVHVCCLRCQLCALKAEPEYAFLQYDPLPTNRIKNDFI